MNIIANVYDYKIAQEEYEYAQALFSGCSCEKKDNDTKAIDYLIDRYLLINEANKYGIEVTDEEWNDKIFEASQRYESEEEYYDFLDKYKLSSTRYEDFLKESILINKFLDKFSDYIKENVTEDVSNLAKNHSELFSCCPQSHVYNILLTGSTEESFKRLMNFREQINTLEDFKQIAKEHSECPAGIECGDMGFVAAGEFIEELDSVIFSLPLDEVSLPIKSKFGYHLILVTERKSYQHLSDEEKKDFVLSSFIDNKSELYLHSYINELRKDAKKANRIVVHSSNQ